MPQNNLRIISYNLVDDSTTTISPSSTASSTTTVANLKNDSKSSVWRSGTRASNSGSSILVLSFTSQQVGGVAIPFSNLSANATIRVRAWTGTTPTLGGTVDSPTLTTTGATLVYDTSSISACPSFPDATTDIPGVNNYAYGTSRYARAWFPSNVTCTSISIELTDTNTQRYFELAKLIVGAFWSPAYNISFGSGVTYNDMTSVSRMESGEQVITTGPRFKGLTFDLKWLNDADRQLVRILLQRNGSRIPVFVSLFPQIQQVAAGTAAEYDLESTYSIYGRLNQVQALIHSTFTIYSNSLQLEEI